MAKANDEIRRVVLLGAGRVAGHLGKALQDAGIEVMQVFSRTEKSASDLANRLQCKFTTHIRDVAHGADLYLFAVSDDALAGLIGQFPHDDVFVAHTSGSQPLDVLKREGLAHGVFYPLQTFSREIVPDFSTIPFCIEASTQWHEQRLFHLASALSRNVRKMDSAQREALHIAAVFSCNFTNHLFHIAQRVLQQNDLPFDILLPLIDETVRKIHHQPPGRVQTGPAVREDQTIIGKHLQRLENEPDYRNIYTFITESIINHKEDV